ATTRVRASARSTRATGPARPTAKPTSTDPGETAAAFEVRQRPGAVRSETSSERPRTKATYGLPLRPSASMPSCTWRATSSACALPATTKAKASTAATPSGFTLASLRENRRQNQRFARKNAISETEIAIIDPQMIQNARAVPKPGKRTFIPNRPVISVSGSRITLTSVSTSRIRFWRCERSEERRVGKEWRGGGWGGEVRKKERE